jgi:signal transduction histidine kinase
MMPGPAHPPRVDLEPLVREVEARIRRHAPRRAVELTVDPEIALTGDVQLLEDVLEQLLGVAWDLTRVREVGHVHVGRIQGPDGPAYFVRDDGPGAADPADPDLAEIATLLAGHGGRVWTEAHPGAGATIYFTLASGAR